MCDKKLLLYRKLANITEWYHRKSFQLTEKEHYWLRGNQSLTKQLIATSKKFEVVVLKEETTQAFPHEAEKLDLRSNEKTRVREVELRCDGIAKVYARSIIPLLALEGSGIQLQNLGNKPLGHLLFKNAEVDLETRELAKMDYQKSQHWARRTNYRFNDENILVSEFFLFEI